MIEELESNNVKDDNAKEIPEVNYGFKKEMYRYIEEDENKQIIEFMYL